MQYLLDTNVVSELQRPEPSEAVLCWYSVLHKEDLFLSVITVGEILQGAYKIMPTRPNKGLSYLSWLNTMRAIFKDRILTVTEEIAEHWGQINGNSLAQGQKPSYLDNLLLATAHVHGLTLVTRNLKDFRDKGVMLFNPWTYAH